MLFQKYFFLIFLFISFIGSHQALKCFVCDGCGKFDMNTRQHVQTCDAGEFFCKKEEAEDGLGWTKIFKECAASCTESDSYNNRVKCCTTDICNTGISCLKGAYFKIAAFVAVCNLFFKFFIEI